ncbi:MAG: tyrosine-protein phosphatase [Turicibacter sp.]|nr:tyrosine-protein phosphatase [Turicibacter sp.]
MTNYIRLPLKNAYNVRDLGGYACDGGVTRWGQFVRADDLGRLDERDMQFLVNYGIRTVIDLRSADELATSPSPFVSSNVVKYINIPLISGKAADVTKLTKMPPADFLPNFYLLILRNEGNAIKKVMETIAKVSAGGILFHCTAGKDRTGIIAALLLRLAGVCCADIIANYEVTHTYIMENPDFVMQMTERKIPIEYIYSNRGYLQPVLDYVAALGGIRAYLESIGVSAETVNRIVGLVVEYGDVLSIND